MAKIHTTNYVETFIAVADDCAAMAGTVPPSRTEPSVAELTHAVIAANPYRYTSDDVIFTVWADRRGLDPQDRPAARAQFFAKGQPCLRSSDLGKRYGWGVHSDSDGRVVRRGHDRHARDALGPRVGDVVGQVRAKA
ncbi:MAG: hypothetical protein H7269_04720 [Cellulomonas sp.]|nr:hypothetical protein [Cellulomonas sp.]